MLQKQMVTLNHFVRKTFLGETPLVNWYSMAQGLRHTKTSDQAEYSRGSEVISSEATKASPEDRLFFECAGFEQSGPAELSPSCPQV